MARKSRLKLNVERNDLNRKKTKLAYYLNKGLSIKDSCTLTNTTAYTLALLRSDPEFDHFVTQSDINYEVELLDIIKDAGECGDWRAVAWILEKKYPEKYGKKDIIKHEYQIKFQNFQRVILEIVNASSPELKRIIVQKLRDIDTSSLKQIEDTSCVSDAEFE